MPLTEIITWRPASEPPDDDREVLVINPTGLFLGFYDNDCWRNEFGGRVQGVTHWAEMPKGPTAEDK